MSIRYITLVPYAPGSYFLLNFNNTFGRKKAQFMFTIFIIKIVLNLDDLDIEYKWFPENYIP